MVALTISTIIRVFIPRDYNKEYNLLTIPAINSWSRGLKRPFLINWSWSPCYFKSSKVHCSQISWWQYHWPWGGKFRIFCITSLTP